MGKEDDELRRRLDRESAADRNSLRSFFLVASISLFGGFGETYDPAMLIGSVICGVLAWWLWD